jgi:hypothetical protein
MPNSPSKKNVLVSVNPINDIQTLSTEADSSQVLNTDKAVEVVEIVEVSGNWERSEYITAQKASDADQHMFDIALTHENNAAKLLGFLARVFACSIAGSTVVLLISANNPNVDKVFLKDTIPSLVDKQVTLLSASIGAYLWTSRKKHNNQK